ncbi:hypothetical protein [Spirochaeta lutea]|uniref:Uncharacterized protein n=1 Tax=Spirochaeta lutea TaxID=1480694 RepID=A0A098R1X3_9SPIO|nr:hypothetical protein [Spirochaeta lutea]KGE73766.1 hypothetical protein DC28_00630 [Spirochaeta lutea]
MPESDQNRIPQEGGRYPILHLKNPDGTSRFFHPFGESVPYPTGDDTIPVFGLFGKEPRVEAIRWFRDSLFGEIEKKIDQLVLERSFIPRFLVASGIFLAGFLSLSLFIRDPLPLLDEILISGGVSIVVFFTLKRRSGVTKEGVDRKLICKEIIDSVHFTRDEGIEIIETVWHRIVHEAPAIDHDELEAWLLDLVPVAPLPVEPEMYHLMVRRTKNQIGSRLSRDLEVTIFQLLRGELLEARSRVKLLRLLTSSGGSYGDYTMALYTALLLFRSNISEKKELE